ncbi:MAG: acyltransferase [Halioglobus sp.]
MTDTAARAVPAAHSLPALTGLRGLAALWVLVYHAWVYATPREILLELLGEPIRVHVFFSLGWAGVQVLFVLSGFLLTLPYARANAMGRAHPRVSRYLLRRVARVFPAYYLQLLLLVVISLFTTGVLLVNWSNAVQYLLMLFVPAPVGIGAPASVNGVWWTLPIELSFYLVLPLVARLADHRRKLLLVVLSLLSMLLWRFFVVTVIQPAIDPPVWIYQLPGSMDTFGLGMLGAVLHVQFAGNSGPASVYSRRLATLLWATPILFVALGMWMARDYAEYWTGAPILYLWTPLFGAAVLVVILNCALNRAWLNALLGNRAVFYLGTVSYGLYLWHAPIGSWLLGSSLIADMQSYPFPRLAALMFLGSLAAASLSWYLVEARAIAAARRRR